MTTAHRPTWAPAKGHEEQGGARLFGSRHAVSGKNMTSHTILKSRKDGQGSARDIEQRDLRLELEERERKHFGKSAEPPTARLLPPENAPGVLHADPVLIPKEADADDSDEADDDDDDDDDDEDDTAALLAELERIKKERAEEAARKEAARSAAEQLEQQAAAADGNPLLQLSGGGAGEADFSMKRRWDDDVIFKNQSRGEPQQKKRFINDTIRSDFHKRFLNRYIK